ncbi:hypothetical protein [uncultured Devosia sp.]|uniref:hypothetical protein n=1 Tax=uncultured Devosia sp. TaxID=211434 RepID=UPI0035CB4459
MPAMLRHLTLLLLTLAALLAASPAWAKAGITSIWQPGYNQLEVFWIDGTGAVNVVWKGADGYWHQPQAITTSGWGIPGSELKALWSVQNDQLEVFWVDGAGALSVVWKDHNGDWHSPAKLTGRGFAKAGSPLTGFWQPVVHQLHVFGITEDGAVSMIYKVNNGRWNAPARMTRPGVAVPGSQPAAVYQSTGEQSQLFYSAPNGTIWLTWKGSNGSWTTPVAITEPGTAATGAWLDAIYYRSAGAGAPKFEQAEVFFTNPRGAAMVAWKVGGDIYHWRTATISSDGYAPPGAPVSAAIMPLANHLETFAIGPDGKVNDVYKFQNGNWHGILPTTGAGAAPAGNTLSATLLPNPAQLEVFYQDAQGAIWVAWKKGNGSWEAPQPLTAANGKTRINYDYCMAYRKDWYAGRRPLDANMSLDCRGYSAAVCRQWHLRGPMVYTAIGGANAIILGVSRNRNPDGSEFIDKDDYNHIYGNIWFGGIAEKRYANGKILGGRFNTRTGHIFFQTHPWKDHNGDGTYGIVKFTAELLEVYRDGPSGGLVASMQGSYFGARGEGGGMWYAPFNQYPAPLYCEDADVLIKPPPPPPPKVYIQTGKPADAMPIKANPAPGASFNGLWVTRVQGGVTYNMLLKQDAAGNVTGDYGAGKISSGMVIGRDLYAVWTQGGVSGTVMFHLAPDAKAFAGMWTQGNHAVKPTAGNVKGSWDGYSSSAFTKPVQSGTFDGSFAMSRAVGEATPLTIRLLPGGKVTGAYNNGSLSGTIISSPGRPTELALQIRDGLNTGSGSFFLYPDGRGFSGYWHNGYAGLNAWSGTLNPAPAAPAPPVIPATPAAPAPSPAPVVPATPPTPAVPATPVQPLPPPPPPAPKVVMLPQGQCPAETAVVRQQINIRDGLTQDGKGGDIIGKAEGNSRIQCLACTDSWCLIAANNPHATVSRGYLDFELPQPVAQPPVVQPSIPQQPAAQPEPAVPQQPAPQPEPPQPAPVAPAEPEPQPQPEPAALASFAGDWWVRTSTGLVQQFHIAQQGAVAGGNYIDTMGNASQFTGQVSGNTLVLNWQSANGYAGVGTFTMRADGSGFAGQYGVQMIPPVNQMAIYASGGTWESFIPTTSEDPDPVYGGCSACGPDVFVGPK